MDKPYSLVLSNKYSKSLPNSISDSGFSRIGSQQALNVFSKSLIFEFLSTQPAFMKSFARE